MVIVFGLAAVGYIYRQFFLPFLAVLLLLIAYTNNYDRAYFQGTAIKSA